MNIVCVCGLGMGSSLILKMSVDKAAQELGLRDCEIEHWDAATVNSKSADLIVTSEDFADQFAGRKDVIFVRSVVNTQEIKEKLKAYLDENNLN